MCSALQVPDSKNPSGQCNGRAKAWVCGRSFVGIVGSNPAGGMDVCLLWLLCVVRWRSLRRADHLSRGVLPTVVCLSVIVRPRNWGNPGPLGAVVNLKKKKQTLLFYDHRSRMAYISHSYIHLQSNSHPISRHRLVTLMYRLDKNYMWQMLRYIVYVQTTAVKWYCWYVMI